MLNSFSNPQVRYHREVKEGVENEAVKIGINFVVCKQELVAQWHRRLSRKTRGEGQSHQPGPGHLAGPRGAALRLRSLSSC